MSMHFQELQLLKPPEYPMLGELVESDTVIHHLATGYLTQATHPDTKTMLYSYTPLTIQRQMWDEVTTLCRGLVCREWKVLGRPLGKAWRINTPIMPETMRENLPPATPELVTVPDGVQVVMFEGLHGPEFAEKRKFVSKATLWAGGYYRRYHREAIWPEGYTPVFQVVGPGMGGVLEYGKMELLLVGLVQRATGEEMKYGEMCGWAEENEVGVVREWRGTLEEAITTMHESKGVVVVWPKVGEPPLKVMIPECGYENVARVVRTVSPVGLWDVMRQGGDLGELREMALPGEFRKWVDRWENKIRTAKVQVETEALEIFTGVGVKEVPAGREERRRVAEEFKTRTKGREHLLPVLFAMLLDNPVDNYSWAAVKKVALEGEQRWEG